MKKRITFTIDENLIHHLRQISKNTMIPQSRLVEKSIKNVLKQYK